MRAARSPCSAMHACQEGRVDEIATFHLSADVLHLLGWSACAACYIAPTANDCERVKRRERSEHRLQCSEDSGSSSRVFYVVPKQRLETRSTFHGSGRTFCLTARRWGRG